MSSAGSGFFPTEVVGALRAPAQIEQWTISRPNPSGLRNNESGVYKPAAKGVTPLAADGLRGGFTAQMESGIPIDFGQSIPNESGFISNTAVITFNLGEVNGHPDSFFNELFAVSGVGTEFKAFNMRFWLSDFSIFESRNPSGIPIFYYLNSAEWRRNFKLTPSTVGAQVVPSSMPITQNWFSKADNVFVSGAFREREFTHFLYLVAQFPSGTPYQLGTYGGSSGFKMQFSYDWTGIDANVLSTDLEPCSGLDPSAF